MLFGNVSPAAAWTPVPDTLPAAETVRLGQACAQTIAALRLPVTLGAAQPVVAEQRGSFRSVMVAGDGDRTGICITQSADHGSASTSWRLSGVYEVGPARGRLTVDAVAGQTGGADQTRVAFGQVQPQVAAVLVETADGRSVTASLAHGRWLAWWPSGAGVTDVQALDGAGRVLATVKQPAEPASVTPTQG